MSRRTLDQAHTYQEIEAHFDHHPKVVKVRQSGSHKTYVGPTGTVTTPVGHRGDMPRPLLRAIQRAALAAGLACLIVAVLVVSSL